MAPRRHAARPSALRLLSLAAFCPARPGAAAAAADAGAAGTAGGAAVCLAGRLRALTRTLGLLRENLLPALRPQGGPAADVFLYSPSPTAEELARLGPLLEAPSPVRAVRFDDEGHVLEELGRTHEEVLRQAMRIRGNWLGSTRRELLPGSRDKRAGTGIFMMHAQNECLDMIETRELRRGAEYSHVVFTRTDLRWIFPHPPLDLLRSDFAWVPDSGEDDWGGLYDKHLVVLRSAAHHALGGWRLLRSGRAKRILVDALGEQALRGNDTNTERWLAVRLLAAGLRVARFPLTGYVSCDPGKWVTQVDARLPMHAVGGFVCSEERDGRYPLEHAAVVSFAACLSSAGRVSSSNWSLSAAQRCYCPHPLPARHPGDQFADWLALCRMSERDLG
mmetsp:Transcript_117767/g.375429  ORF Transcript_117767/g.375429 Transcript_117767/m.375429 type:complete len:391 (-) Transcript_117767:364-1536(-)